MREPSLHLVVRWVGVNKHWVLTVFRDGDPVQRVVLRAGQTEAREAGQALLELWQLREGGA